MSRRSSIISFFVSLLVAVSLVAAGAPASRAADDPCAAQTAALEQVSSQISRHNAEPHTFLIPEEQAAYDAYNVEADQLNAAHAKAISDLKTCEETLGALADQEQSSAPLKRPSNYIRDKLNRIKDKIGADFQPYKNVGTAGYWRVPPQLRELYNALRSDNPGTGIGSPSFQGMPRPNVGDLDPAYPDDPIPSVPGNPDVPDVKADHIISLAELINLPGFTGLSAENMFMMSRAPLNFQWLSDAANLAKSSRDVGFIEDMDPAWIKDQQALHDTVRSQLEKIIQKLLASQ